MLKEIKHLLYKEFLLEWRNKYALNGVLLYVFSTIFICFYSFKSIPDANIWNVLFWIIMLFTAVNAVAKSFLQEPKNRMLYLYSICAAESVLIAKTVFNILFMLLITAIALLFYSIIFGFKAIDFPMYLLSIFTGSITFSVIFTMISAIAAKSGNGSVMTILSFPIIIPMIMLLEKLAKNALDGLDRSLSIDEIIIVLAGNIMVFAVSLLLFPYLWRD